VREPSRRYTPSAPPSLLIAGVGGSGTRVFARLTLALRWHLGSRRNTSEDSLDVADFDYRFAPPFVAGIGDIGEMAREFEENVLPLLQPGGRWGWKHPPSIHLVPFYAERLPGLRFLHVVRDGRDIIVGGVGADVHLDRLGPAVLDGDGRSCGSEETRWAHPDPPLLDGAARRRRRAAFWAATNSAAADFGEKVLGERYLRVRLEDLVDSPAQEAARIAGFLGESVDASAYAGIVRPASLGTWRDLDLDGDAAAIEPELRRFGYV